MIKSVMSTEMVVIMNDALPLYTIYIYIYIVQFHVDVSRICSEPMTLMSDGSFFSSHSWHSERNTKKFPWALAEGEPALYTY